MLHSKGLPIQLWAKAVNCAVYLLNRVPSRWLQGKTPFEIWTETKPDISRLKIFGSECFAHIPKQHRKKWDAKSKKLLFVGYEKESSNYRLYDPSTRKISISRHVVFNKQVDTKIALIEENETSFPLDESNNNIQSNAEQEYALTNQNASTDDTSTNEYETCSTSQEEESPNLVKKGSVLRDRSKIKKPTRYEANLSEIMEHQTFHEAVTGSYNEEWRKAIDEELKAHRINGTWKMEHLPPGKATIGHKWVFKIKESLDQSPRFKARLCAKGFTQRRGVDYEEIFSPVVRHESIRILLSIAAEQDLKIEQFDIKTAFLHGDLCEEIYMEVPEGVTKDTPEQVCRLQKSLYDLKQASRQ